MNYSFSLFCFFFIWFGFFSIIEALSLQTFLIFFHCLFFHTNGNNYMLFSQESFFSLWHTHMLVFLPQVLCCFTSFPTFHFPLSFTKMYKDPNACTPEKLWFGLLYTTFTPLIEEEPLVVPEESRQGCLYCREGRDYRNHLSQAFMSHLPPLTGVCILQMRLSMTSIPDSSTRICPGSASGCPRALWCHPAAGSAGSQLPVHILHAVFMDTSQRKLGFRF